MTIYDVWFTRAFGVNCSNAQKIIDYGLSPEQLYSRRFSLSSRVFSSKQISSAKKLSLEDVESSFDEYKKYGVESINYTDSDFPQRLTGFRNRPLVLYYKGDFSLFSSQYTVGIVGSRHFHPDSEYATKLIAKDIANLGGVVVSGLAQGVDVTAHTTSVENGGRTIAFLGTELTKYFPTTHRDFQIRLEKTDLVVSEYIHGTKYYSSNFVNRNRLIAAASDGVCIIQAAPKSGSLSTAHRALSMNRQLFVVPGNAYRENFAGSNQLLYDGLATAVRDGKQIMTALGYKITQTKTTNKKEKTTLPEDLSPTAVEIYKILADGAKFSREIIKAVNKPVSAVNSAITELQIENLILKSENGAYIRNKSK